MARTDEQIRQYWCEYYLKNKDAVNERCKAYYHANKERILAREAKKYQEGKEIRKAYAKLYYERNRERLAEKHRKAFKDKMDVEKRKYLEIYRVVKEAMRDVQKSKGG